MIIVEGIGRLLSITDDHPEFCNCISKGFLGWSAASHALLPASIHVDCCFSLVDIRRGGYEIDVTVEARMPELDFNDLILPCEYVTCRVDRPSS